MKQLLLLLSLLLMLNSISKAQADPSKSKQACFPLGVVNKIWSNQLSEERILNIYLPEGYDTSTKKYPVIYLLDGSANEDFIHICGIVQFLTMIGAMPQTIVVGIANVDRRRDFTFPTTIAQDKKDFPTTGSSEKFIRFIELDLLPFVQQNCRVSSSTIIGQSLGGLLATEILLKKPALFDTYIIVSPSLWWDNESLLEKAPALLKSLPAKNTTVYISAGNEGKIMEADVQKLRDLLQQNMNPHLKVFYSPEPEEDHLTILHNCIYKALKTLNKK